MKTFQEHPQSVLLSDSIQPILKKIHSNRQYCIGQDCRIYWGLTDPPERGVTTPDWFYIPNVPPLFKGKFRQSYFLWQEYLAPLIVLEFLFDDGSKERDKTPVLPTERFQKPGKFWVYEKAIRVPFYGIYDVNKASVEVYQLIGSHYQQINANDRGHYPIPEMGVELGIWQGQYGNIELPWLRWWDSEGNLLLTGYERAEQERQRADRLAERLREMGINPDEM